MILWTVSDRCWVSDVICLGDLHRFGKGGYETVLKAEMFVKEQMWQPKEWKQIRKLRNMSSVRRILWRNAKIHISYRFFSHTFTAGFWVFHVFHTRTLYPRGLNQFFKSTYHVYSITTCAVWMCWPRCWLSINSSIHIGYTQVPINK